MQIRLSELINSCHRLTVAGHTVYEGDMEAPDTLFSINVDWSQEDTIHFADQTVHLDNGEGEVLDTEGKAHWLQAETVIPFMTPEMFALLKANAARYAKLSAMTWDTGPFAVVHNPKQEVKLGAYCPSGGRLDADLDKLPEQA